MIVTVVSEFFSGRHSENQQAALTLQELGIMQKLWLVHLNVFCSRLSILHQSGQVNGPQSTPHLDQDIILVLVMMIALQAQTNGR